MVLSRNLNLQGKDRNIIDSHCLGQSMLILAFDNSLFHIASISISSDRYRQTVFAAICLSKCLFVCMFNSLADK